MCRCRTSTRCSQILFGNVRSFIGEKNIQNAVQACDCLLAASGQAITKYSAATQGLGASQAAISELELTICLWMQVVHFVGCFKFLPCQYCLTFAYRCVPGSHCTALLMHVAPWHGRHAGCRHSKIWHRVLAQVWVAGGPSRGWLAPRLSIHWRSTCTTAETNHSASQL